MTVRKLSPKSENTETLNFKIDSSEAYLFKKIVDKEGLTVSEALRSIVERYIKLKGRLVK